MALLRDVYAKGRYAAKSVLLLAGFRIGLRLMPFRQVLRWVGRSEQVSKPLLRFEDRQRAALIARTVKRIGPYLLRRDRPCLPEALTVYVMLQREAYPATLRIGVARGETGGRALEAHAWVESEGVVVIGGADAPERFTPLPAIEMERT